VPTPTTSPAAAGPEPTAALAPRTTSEWLLTRDPVQQVRLSQMLLAMAVMAAGVLAMSYFVWVGVARLWAVVAWSLGNLLGMAVFFLLVRSGWSRRLRDPSLTLPQMIFAITSAALAYGLLGAARGAVFPVVMVVLMFGMFVANPRQMRWISLYAVLLFTAVMVLLALLRPWDYPVLIEFGHFLLLATMLPAVSILAGRVSRMRHRARLQRTDLSQALARLREHTTRDELTGLINKRHMVDVMEQEHQRCIRSGQTFCLAMLDIDSFKPVNEAHGYAVGDAVLRAVADETLRQVRVSDPLARWDSDCFVLLLSDTRAVLARGGLERLHQRVAALRILNGGAALGVTLSAGLAEHHAGETVAQTLARAQRALADAKTQGRNRVVVAA
jgi:diguanylate cyclase